MNKIFIRKKEQYFDWLFILVAILSAISRIFSFSVESDMWWDSSVYIGMGKHIYSFGQSGLWEASRPLGWPLMLGFFWKIGLDPILFGKITVGLASLGCIILTYLISSKLFGRKTAFFAGLFLAFSPTFFLFGNILYSEIISTFFLLAGIYFFVARKHAFAGLFLGISFITRFFQIFSIIPVIFAYLYCLYKKKYSVKNIIVFAASFLAPVLPYLLLNLYLYGNIFYPFQLQAFMTKYTGWIYHQGIYFYFIGLAKENFVSIFSIIGIITIFRSKDAMKKSFALMLLLPFLPYILASHKEMRILIPILPFLYIAAGIGLLYFAKLFKKHINLALAIILALSIFQVAPQLRFDRYEDNLDAFYNYIKSANLSGSLWITNPSFILYSDMKADELMYYPLYDSGKSKGLQAKSNDAGTVLFNSCDLLPCPLHDDSCIGETKKLVAMMNSRLKILYRENAGRCEYLIFGR